jgi:hypothetical protein
MNGFNEEWAVSWLERTSVLLYVFDLEQCQASQLSSYLSAVYFVQVVWARSGLRRTIWDMVLSPASVLLVCQRLMGVDRNVLRPLRSNEAKKTYQDGLFYGELPSILFVVGALAAR